MTARYFLKCAASMLATLVGASLLLADSTNDCETYAALKASLDFTSDCPLVPSQGHLSLDFPEQSETGRYNDEKLAAQQLTSAGLGVSSSVALNFAGDCSSGEGHGEITNMVFNLVNSDGTAYTCGNLPLPVAESRTVTCRSVADGSAGSRQDAADGSWQDDAGVTRGPFSCTIVFHPAPN